jgi:hypothetical protein
MCAGQRSGADIKETPDEGQGIGKKNLQQMQDRQA